MTSTLKIILGALLLCLPVGCAPDKDKKDETTTDPVQKPQGPGALALEDIEADLGAVGNLRAIVRATGVDRLQTRGYRGQNLKIAVFDNGYTGLNHSSGKRLPPDLKVMPAPGNEMADTTHGTKMAEIAYAVATGSPHWAPEISGPQMLLYNTNGFTNLKAAVDDAVNARVDIILYAQVWEYGDNDGTDGFVNEAIRKATEAGILWVNASGNFGLTTFRAPLELVEGGKVKLPWEERYLRLYVTAPVSPARIVLSWNDFDRSPDYRTPQNLDLRLLNSSKEVIATSDKDQNGGRDSTHSLFSAHAREIINTVLEAGTYYIAIDAKSRNFDPGAKITVAVDGPGVSMPEATGEDSLMAPAGNPGVIAVGALDSRKTSVLVRDGQIVKPELFLTSNIEFTDGIARDGTSAASAIATGALAAWISANGKASAETVRTAANAGVFGFGDEFCVQGRSDLCLKVNTLRVAGP